MKKGIILIFVGLITILFLVGCPGPQKVQLSILTASPINLTECDTQTIQVFTSPENAVVEFSSNNEDIASVDANSGEITAVASGTTDIKIRASAAGYESVEKVITVNVTDYEITITYSPDPMVLEAGGLGGSITVNFPFISNISFSNPVLTSSSNCVNIVPPMLPLYEYDYSIVPQSVGNAVITVSATATIGSGDNTKVKTKTETINVTVN